MEHGTEKKARLWLADELDAVEELRGIGPDPTREGLTVERFAARACERAPAEDVAHRPAIDRRDRERPLGRNMWEARLSPLQRPTIWTTARWRGFTTRRDGARAPGNLLRESAAGALPQKEPVEHYAVHDHKGEPCPRCETPIAWVSYADRDTFYCPGCQTGGVPLKDRRMSKLLK